MKKQKNNLLELFYADYNFFDQEVKYDQRLFHTNNWPASKLWLSYTRILGTKNNAINLSYHMYGMIYLTPNHTSTRIPGDIYRREINFWVLNYLHPLIVDHKFSIWASGGLRYKKGFETIFISYGVFDTHVRTRYLSDVGLMPGLVLTSYLPCNFTLTGDVNYSYFVYRKEKGHIDPMPIYDYGSSKHLFGWNVRVGFRF